MLTIEEKADQFETLVDENELYKNACIFSIHILRKALRHPPNGDESEALRLAIHESIELLDNAIPKIFK